jgi:DNA-directed RNA polymerase specialized sigma24 family protein
LTAPEDNPEERYARREMRARVAKAITRLGPELRQVCLLRDVLQYSTQEVAQRLRISTVAVRLRLFRAHRKLREELRDVLRTKRQGATGTVAPLNAAKRRTGKPGDEFLPMNSLPEYACGD